VCVDSKPSGTPDLFQITTTQTTATVYFTPVSGVSKYFISYSVDSFAEAHGVEVVLTSEGVQQFTIEHLTSGTTYYFKVRGQNGCAPGNWSSIKASFTPSTSQNYFGFVTHTLFENQSMDVVDITTGEPEKCKHTVAPGDTLWSIAAEAYGQGDLYQNILRNNREKYPNIETVLAVGWELDFQCKKDEKFITPGSTNIDEPNTHDISIKIEYQGKRLANANIELNSKPKYGRTDENGEVFFANVEKGVHTLKIAYEDYTAEQKLVIDGDTREVDIAISVELSRDTFPIWGVGVIVFFILVILLLFFLLSRKKLIYQAKNGLLH
jgi:LysM repeat protein